MDTDPLFQEIDKKYSLVKKIGGGSFSEVFLVSSPQGTTALKLLKKNPLAIRQSEMLSDFKNEFSILKNLNHPNIARILDFGLDASLERHYFTTEWVDGKDLFTATEGVSHETVLERMVQALRALEYLHASKIFHFDLKAANILVRADGTVKVIDFGLASITPATKMIGTPTYMAPEIINRERPDGRADLYSLGVLFYYCLARQNPFRANGVQETLKRQQMFSPPPPSSVDSKIPPFLDRVVMHLLQKNPADRYQRASEVIRDINQELPNKFPMETSETLLSYLPEEGKLIGRSRELALLKNIFNTVYKEPGPPFLQWAVVSGEVGTGKSRLLKELKYYSQLEQIPVIWMNGGEAVSLPAPTETVLFILDDLDLLENPEEFLQPLRVLSQRKQLFLFSSKKPELIHDLLKGFPGQTVSLEPFTAAELKSYLITLTGLEAPPETLVQALYKRTAGNPLFVTEVLKSLIVQGALFDSGGRWKETMFEDVGVDFSKILLPQNLEGLLLERVQQLSVESRKILELIALFKRPVSLGEISEVGSLKNLSPLLSTLVREEFLVRHKETRNYELKNLLMGEAIEKGLAEEEAGLWHEKIAATLKKKKKRGLAEEIATHEGRVRDRKVAFRQSLKLGEFYLEKGRSRLAIDCFSWASKICPEVDPTTRFELLMKLGESHLIGQNYPTALGYFAEAEKVIGGSTDSLLRIGGTYLKIGEREKARSCFTRVLALVGQEREKQVTKLVCQHYLAYLHLQDGELKKSQKLFQQGRRLWRFLPKKDRAKVTNNDLGIISLLQGKFREAVKLFREDLSFYTSIGDKQLMARCHYNIAEASLRLKKSKEAIGHYKKCVALSQKIENRELLLRAYNGLGNLYMTLGDLKNSSASYQRGLLLSEKWGDARSQASILINTAIVENKQGHTKKAHNSLQPALAYLRNLQEKTSFDWASLCRGLLELGDLERDLKNRDLASSALDEALAICQKEKIKGQLSWILHSKKQLLKTL